MRTLLGRACPAVWALGPEGRVANTSVLLQLQPRHGLHAHLLELLTTLRRGLLEHPEDAREGLLKVRKLLKLLGALCGGCPSAGTFNAPLKDCVRRDDPAGLQVCRKFDQKTAQ